MSSRINICDIVFGHFRTLRQTSNNKIGLLELLIFIILPIILSIAIIFVPLQNKEIISLLVNLGSIFSALLLSVLVLVFDQEQKLEDRKEIAEEKGKAVDPLFPTKKTLLEELYYNISYSVFCSIALVSLCLLYSSIKYIYILHGFILKPLIAFMLINILLNILMILKRMHTLLVNR
ncbi:hypothetical protein ABTF87_10605 [Acinetobacter baumannii]|uniref:Uncharacterized protein n=4 Tax=Acinetobacter baumannii TaxID=470 RepID=A0ABD5DNZ0_ACIBA|nr:hypothetical protein [Acinetobacter baumannii]QJJ20119.1 hypothetical protein HJX53_29840 [Klebsiella pneumoniae]ALY01291.1 Putative membrane protein [Acinetobacter baumannii]AMC17444.1 hypothetical protein AXA63_18600 [Acinetobacter baumannii]AOX83171.1 hypothetical protein KAB04_03768 [Acinetobacter baumannii]AOX91279.1 hypothetical protein KAB07_00114 [Acinetobacter baumannii]